MDSDSAFMDVSQSLFPNNTENDETISLPYGRDRFDHITPCPIFSTATTYSGRYQEVHPGVIDRDEFNEWWNRQPFYLEKTNTCSYSQWLYRGAKDHIICRQEVFYRRVKRGDPVILYGQESDIVRYFATYRRGVDRGISVVQLDAFSSDGRLINDRHPDWGTQIIDVPNNLCDVPFPRALQPFFPDYFAPEECPPQQPLSMTLRQLAYYFGLQRRNV